MFTEARALWLYENYRWLERQLPPREHGAARLILPTPEFFPIRNTGDHAWASAMFEATRGFMELSHWPCRLVPHVDSGHQQRESLGAAGVLGGIQTQDAAGTFSIQEEVEITYSPTLLRDPVGIVATFAHELCHYLLATVKEEPPCGWPEHEPLTDLAAVHEGFGVFLCNSAFHFGQWSSGGQLGWEAGRRGYLNESELGFATAIFCVRSKIDPELAMAHLKRNPGEVFWDSLDYIEDLEKARRDEDA